MKHNIIPLVLLLGFIATAFLLLSSVRSDVTWYFALGLGILFSVLGCAALEHIAKTTMLKVGNEPIMDGD